MPDDEFSPVWIDGKPINGLARSADLAAGKQLPKSGTYGDMRTSLQPDTSGFEDIQPWIKPCINPMHAPPTMLVVPEGKRYRHVCPGCKAVAYLYPVRYFL